MTPDEINGVLLGVVLAMAEDIYFRKCLFYNVPCLSDSDKKKCIDEAVEALPEVIEFYQKVSEAISEEENAWASWTCSAASPPCVSCADVSTETIS